MGEKSRERPSARDRPWMSTAARGRKRQGGSSDSARPKGGGYKGERQGGETGCCATGGETERGKKNAERTSWLAGVGRQDGREERARGGWPYSWNTLEGAQGPVEGAVGGGGGGGGGGGTDETRGNEMHGDIYRGYEAR